MAGALQHFNSWQDRRFQDYALGMRGFGSGCRLSIIRYLPIPDGDATSATVLYLVPYVSAVIELYDPQQNLFVPRQVPYSPDWQNDRGVVSISAAGGTAGKAPFTTVTTVMDIFAKWNVGAGKIELDYESWSSTSARTAATSSTFPRWMTTWGLGYFQGYYVRAIHRGALKLCPEWLYLGTVYTGSGGTLEDTAVSRCVWNMFNPVARPLFTCPGYSDFSSSTSYSTTSATWTEANAGTNSKVDFVLGLPRAVSYQAQGSYYQSTQFSEGYLGVGEDSASSAKVAVRGQAPVANLIFPLGACGRSTMMTAGYHYLDLLITVGGSGGTANYYADFLRLGSSADPYATTLSGFIMG